jgi:hypothetical protein
VTIIVLSNLSLEEMTNITVVHLLLHQETRLVPHIQLELLLNLNMLVLPILVAPTPIELAHEQTANIVEKQGMRKKNVSKRKGIEGTMQTPTWWRQFLI